LIYFGILHLIGISIILLIPLIRFKWLNLVLGVLIWMIPAFVNLASFEVLPLLWLGFASPFPTLDFFPVIPWFGAVLFGAGIGNIFYSKGISKFSLQEPNFKLNEYLKLFGRKSLLIYFAHFPIIFTLIMLGSVAFNLFF